MTMKWLTYLAANGKINPRDIGMDPVTNDSAALAGVLNTVYMVAGMVAVLVIIAAGYWYVVSNGDASRVKRAKDAILGAVVGLIIVITAFIITQFILGRF